MADDALEFPTSAEPTAVWNQPTGLYGKTYPLLVVNVAAAVMSVAALCHLKFVAVVFVNCKATTLIEVVAFAATICAVPSVFIDTVPNAGAKTVVELPFAIHFVFCMMATAG